MALRFIAPASIALGYAKAKANDTGFVAGAPVFATSEDQNLYPFDTTGGDISGLAVSSLHTDGAFIGICDDQSNTKATDSTVISGAGGGVRATESVLGVSNVILPGIATHEASGKISVYTQGVFATDAIKLFSDDTTEIAPFTTADLRIIVPGSNHISVTQGFFQISATLVPTSNDGVDVSAKVQFLGFKLLDPSDAQLEGLGDAGSYENQEPRIYAVLKLS